VLGTAGPTPNTAVAHLKAVRLPDLVPGPGQQLYDVSTAGLNFADTHHRLS
jgi:hypothetical protein